MVVFIEKSAWEGFESGNLVVDSTTENSLSRSVPCSAIAMDVYHKTADIDPENDLACRLLYFDVLSFTGKFLFQMKLIKMIIWKLL